MRLYLSSYQLGARPDVFKNLVRGSGRGWVIMNALDGAMPGKRCSETQSQIAILAGIGLEACELDLRPHDAESLIAVFGEPDFVWVRGGNVFTLRAALARSGADKLIVQRIRSDGLVYGGFSAGACVLAPSLAGLEACDSLDEARTLYGSVTFDGLGVLDRPFVPHLYSVTHPESDVLMDMAAAYTHANQPYWGLRDGQVLVIKGSNVVLM